MENQVSKHNIDITSATKKGDAIAILSLCELSIANVEVYQRHINELEVARSELTRQLICLGEEYSQFREKFLLHWGDVVDRIKKELKVLEPGNEVQTSVVKAGLNSVRISIQCRDINGTDTITNGDDAKSIVLRPEFKLRTHAGKELDFILIWVRNDESEQSLSADITVKSLLGLMT